ncbi:MAG: biotin/lipoyl-binding protein [Prolixibacteraceae bacterium]|jgi:biotin carboxyl carrier protein|nr:biotin/lipoyl-binding protein [Prolixibacteraceae bacterium]
MKKYKFTIQGNEYDVRIKDFEDKVAQIEVNGTEYEVEIHHEVKQSKTPRLVRKPVAQKPGEGEIAKSQGGGTIKVEAPLPGSIFKMLVKEGDTIKKGDTLLVMEAMKMENNVLAEKDGVVSSIKVKEGDAVLQGDLLIEM